MNYTSNSPQTHPRRKTIEEHTRREAISSLQINPLAPDAIF